MMLSISSEVEPAISAILAGTGTPGAAVAIVHDGTLVVDRAVGFADIARTRRLAASAPFYLYSVSKIALAAALLRLVEQRLIGLDAPASTVLSELALDSGVTVRRILNHTGGLPDYGGDPAYHEAVRARPAHPWTDDDFLAFALARGLLFRPGEGWSYSNIGYLIARHIIERLTGETIDHAVRRLVFAPLGVPEMSVATSLADAARLTPGYTTDLAPTGAADEVAEMTGRYHPGWVSHRSIIGTAAQTARLLDGILRPSLLERATVERMLDAVPVPARHPLIRAPAYGFGLMIDRASSYGRVAGHAGGGPGFATAAFTFPDIGGHRVTIAALANRDGGDTGTRICFALADGLARGAGGANPAISRSAGR